MILAIYAKNDKSDLRPAEKREIAGLLRAMENAKVIRTTSRRLADDIRASLREAIDHAAGQRTGAVVRKISPRATDARLKLGLSQREFAAFIGTGVGTVRKWELGTRRPSGPARTLIEVIKAEPKAIRRALGKRPPAA
jgi:putative transcriptional regulator